jgi:hypothetical protein
VKTKSRFVSIAIAAILIVGCAWVLGSGAIVASRAERLAGDRPYCVQVSSSPDYAQARGTRDFSALRMWAAPGNNHAVLVLGDVEHAKLWHWSYRAQDFEPDAYGPPAIFCTPSRHFAKQFPSAATRDTQNVEFYLSGRYFSVPMGFRPAVKTASRKGMSFYARAPAFTQVEGPPAEAAKDRADLLDHFVLVTFARDESHLQPVSTAKLEAAGEAYGLERQYVHWSGSRSTAIDYFARDQDGRIVTAILCVDNVVGQCMHVFERHGWTYEFHHSPLELRNWQALEDNLSARAESFVRKADN